MPLRPEDLSFRLSPDINMPASAMLPGYLHLRHLLRLGSRRVHMASTQRKAHALTPSVLKQREESQTTHTNDAILPARSSPLTAVCHFLSDHQCLG